MRSERPLIGSQRPLIGSEKLLMVFERPHLESEKLQIGSERPLMASERPMMRCKEPKGIESEQGSGSKGDAVLYNTCHCGGREGAWSHCPKEGRA